MTGRRLAEVKDYWALYGPAIAHERPALAEHIDWLLGLLDRLQVRVTYREQTIEALKAELERNNQAFQRLIPDAERAEELEREVKHLRRQCSKLVAGRIISMDAPPPESSARTGPPEDYDG